MNAILRPVPSSTAWKSIGRPIANTRAYVLSDALEPMPVAVPGELYIDGAGLARGYWKRPELTAEHFPPDPFIDHPGQRMYRTGDVTTFRSDGEIEFLGRNDFQIKIRGYRMELGEIQARLEAHPAIAGAVVMAHAEEDGEKRLVGYYTERASTHTAIGELREWLAAKLPDNMVPTAFVRLDEMPLTESGKLDRRRLPAAARASHPYEEPIGDTEQAVAAIWAEVLKVERIGRQDQFFELGGHSLLAMQIAARLRQHFSMEIRADALFARPVLASLAEWIIDQQLAAFEPDELAGALKLMQASTS